MLSGKMEHRIGRATADLPIDIQSVEAIERTAHGKRKTVKSTSDCASRVGF